jgi:hypothetical protein
MVIGLVALIVLLLCRPEKEDDISRLVVIGRILYLYNSVSLILSELVSLNYVVSIPKTFSSASLHI